jgi:hypothetical protein
MARILAFGGWWTRLGENVSRQVVQKDVSSVCGSWRIVFKFGEFPATGANAS